MFAGGGCRPRRGAVDSGVLLAVAAPSAAAQRAQTREPVLLHAATAASAPAQRVGGATQRVSAVRLGLRRGALVASLRGQWLVSARVVEIPLSSAV